MIFFSKNIHLAIASSINIILNIELTNNPDKYMRVSLIYGCKNKNYSIFTEDRVKNNFM